jgi:hypothetical protein
MNLQILFDSAEKVGDLSLCILSLLFATNPRKTRKSRKVDQAAIFHSGGIV